MRGLIYPFKCRESCDKAVEGLEVRRVLLFRVARLPTLDCLPLETEVSEARSVSLLSYSHNPDVSSLLHLHTLPPPSTASWEIYHCIRSSQFEVSNEQIHDGLFFHKEEKIPPGLVMTCKDGLNIESQIATLIEIAQIHSYFLTSYSG